jgi:tetratricopeptide (TPR) repeat protein
VDGEIVVGEIITGEIIRAEVVATGPALVAPVEPGTAASEAADSGDADSRDADSRDVHSGDVHSRDATPGAVDAADEASPAASRPSATTAAKPAMASDETVQTEGERDDRTGASLTWTWDASGVALGDVVPAEAAPIAGPSPTVAGEPREAGAGDRRQAADPSRTESTADAADAGTASTAAGGEATAGEASSARGSADATATTDIKDAAAGKRVADGKDISDADGAFDADGTATDASAGAEAGHDATAGDEHGLGWLLEVSGLGAVDEPEAVTEPDPAAEATATGAADHRTPVDAGSGDLRGDAPGAERHGVGPVSGVPAADDWFAPATDPRMIIADELRPAQPAERADAAQPEAPTHTAQAPAAESLDAAAASTAAESLSAAAAGTATDAGDTARPADTGPWLGTADPAGGAAAAKPAAVAPDAETAEVPARQQGDQPDEPERRLVDPEQVLAAYKWRLDPETLRELVDDPEQLWAVRDRLTDKVEYAERDSVRARLLSLRAVVSRILGDLGRALVDGREALGHAEATGELRRTAIAAARLAHVLQWRGEFAEADKLFTEANSVELPDRLRAEMYELAGRSAYDQGRYIEAMNHFEAALDLGKGEDLDMVGRIEVALDAVLNRVRANGWGPYSRSREEILQLHRSPEPAYDERTRLWGYVDAVPARYLDVQPFHEGRAWVRRPNSRMWELIDEAGELVIDASAGYLGATEFSEGLAWVARDGAGGWFAIDQRNRVIIPGGFDDVRPFRRGVAPVRRGGWGAIDRHGRIVVQPKYRAFATMLTGGRRVEGFTDEGLAVIDAGDRLGVVDRTGQLIVAPVHAALVIHPVAFLIGDRNGRWGALDRRGDPLIDVTHSSESEVTQAIDHLLADTRPVL